MDEKFYRIECYVPESHLEKVKEALFGAGAGRLGSYKDCCFSFPGKGEFCPLANTEPFLGTPGKKEVVTEWKIEILCPENILKKALLAMLEAHPYETPAYQFFPVQITPPER